MPTLSRRCRMVRYRHIALTVLLAASFVATPALGQFDAEITPRFPDGLTVLKGFGQFRESSGQIVQESSFVLILLYPRETLRDSSGKIEEIRALYKERFEQESVLRVDDPRPVRVSF